MEHINNTFAQCKQQGRSALVTYVTAGFPTADETVDILLGMEAGGAGVYLDDQANNKSLTIAYRFDRTWPSFHRPNC